MRKKILLVDDMSTVRALEKATLGDAYDYIEARDGLEAFEQARAARPDLIVMDLHMPGHDGVGALRLLRADRATSKIPVILVTTTAEASRFDRSGALGPIEIVDKPRLRSDLGSVVRKVLGESP